MEREGEKRVRPPLATATPLETPPKGGKAGPPPLPAAPSGPSPKRGRPGRKQPAQPWLLPAWIAGGAIAILFIAAILWFTRKLPSTVKNDASRVTAAKLPETAMPLSKPAETKKPATKSPTEPKPDRQPEPAEPGAEDAEMGPPADPAGAKAQPARGTTIEQEEDRLKEAAATAKTPEDHKAVAEKGFALVDRAIVKGDPDLAKRAAIQCLAAARNTADPELARRATLLHLQLQKPLTEAMKEEAKTRLAPTLEPEPPPATTVHDQVRWGKTEPQRRQIFYELLQAVDEHGMTPAGRKAWRDIQDRHGINAEITLKTLGEGFGRSADWKQPAPGGTAAVRMNRMKWIAERTKSGTEPMLRD